MKLLVVNPAYTKFGGIESYCHELTEGLMERRVEIKSVSIDVDELMRSLAPLDYVPRWSHLQRYYFWRNFYLQDFRFHNAIQRVISRILRQWRPEVVHFLHPYLYASVPRGVASVVTCHGLEVDRSPPLQRALQQATLIHCNSHFTRERALSAAATDAERLAVLSWGIKEPIAPSAPAEKKWDLVTVGRLVRRKNIDGVLRTLVRLPLLSYAIVGDGPERESLESLARELRLENVSFMGSVSESKKCEILRTSRAFIMCPHNDRNDDVEGLGLVYFEAQRFGIPCIGAHSGGVPDAIGEAGVLVQDPKSEDQIAAAIDHVFDTENYQRLLNQVSGRQSTASWQRFIDGFISLYWHSIEIAQGRCAGNVGRELAFS